MKQSQREAGKKRKRKSKRQKQEAASIHPQESVLSRAGSWRVVDHESGDRSLATKILRPDAVAWQTRPLIEPRKDKDIESLQTFNTGAVVIEGKFHFLYRAIGWDSVSRFGYANSNDGVHIDKRLDHPVFQYNLVRPSVHSYASGGSVGGIEDPRIVRIDDSVYTTYTVCDSGGLSVALASVKVDDFLDGDWEKAVVRALSPPSETHKNWVLFSDKVRGKYALIHSLSPKILIHYFDDLELEGANFVKSYHNGVLNGHWNGGWEGWVRGVGAPPLKTDYGWLVFYHALPKNNMDAYCIGSMLLDVDDPTKVLFKAKKPVITPWDVVDAVKPNVVYTCGAATKDGQLCLYHGAGDTRVRVAHSYLDEFLRDLMCEGANPAPSVESNY